VTTGIEWTDETWNPVVGCTKVSAGCKSCYAFELHGKRHEAYKHGNFPTAPAQYHEPFSTVQLLPERLEKPLHWRKPRRVFVNSVSDLFHERVPNEFIAEVFLIMGQSQRHTFQILTKRPGRMAAFMEVAVEKYRPFRKMSEVGVWPLPNVWLGTSVEDQSAADERIPHLLRTPAAVRFLSCEPLLGRVNLDAVALKPGAFLDALQGDVLDRDGVIYAAAPGRIDWVIAGGESGPRFRSLDLDHARALRDQCVAAGVPFLFKQIGGRTPKSGGRLLDGRVWHEFPQEVRHGA
jgi:protein gp37